MNQQKNPHNKNTQSVHDAIYQSLKGQIIAHRGARAIAPENTLSSFKIAAKMNAQWVEFDTQCCGTNEWVIMHDETLDRTTNGHGKVSDTPFEVLKQLDAGSWFHPDFKNERILLLSELLQYLQELGLKPNIEIKVFSQVKEIKENSLSTFLQILKQYWPPHLTPPLLSSFDWETLVLLKKMDPSLCLGFNVEQLEASTVQQIKRLDCFSVHCNYENLESNLLDTAISQETRILLYTINNAPMAKQYLDQGVTAIFSDYPNLLSHPDSVQL